MIAINKIVESSYVDGAGLRTVLFMQGCSIHCKGCQNRALWDPSKGEIYDEEQLAQLLVEKSSPHHQITISGGEPFDQPGSLARLVMYLRKYGANHIIVYSGYTFDQLIHPVHGVPLWVDSIFQNIDVLVDGQYIKEMDDPFITYRGSWNQRIIDIPATLESQNIVELNWEFELVLTNEGSALMPLGLAKEFVGLGEALNTRMCGQTREIPK
jgi:anaerobic ribonucleoside-triphosphate reductase activating protein